MHSAKFARGATLAMGWLAASYAVAVSAQGLEEIVVTGSYIKGPSMDTPSPVTVIGRDAFDRQGAGTMWDVVKNLTANSGSTTAPNTDGTNSDSAAGTANVNLRGLGQNATLVLFNGKRQVSAAQLMVDGSEYVDINGLPMIAVERVEILSDGGSALYGSDAIAGVVNYVLRTDFDGLELRADAQHVDDSGSAWDKTFGGLWGWAGNSGHTHFVLGGEYFDRDPIPVTAASNYNRNKVPHQFVGPGSGFIPLSTEVNPAFYATGRGPTDPQCQAMGFRTGYVTDLPTAPSTQCWEDVTDEVFLDFGQRRYNLVANLSHEFSSAATLSIMARYAHDDIQRTDTGAANGLGPVYMMPVMDPAVPLTVGIPFVGSTGLGSQAAFAGNTPPTITNAPITTANGGLNVPSLVSFITRFPRPDGGGGNHRKNTSDTKAVSVDLKGDFSGSWSYDVSLGYSSNERLREDRVLSRSRLELALNGLGGPNCQPNGRTDFDFSRAGAYWESILGPSVYFGNYAPGYPRGSRQNMSLTLTSSNQGVGNCQFLNPYLTTVTNPALGNSDELINWVAPVVPLSDKKNELYVFDAVLTGDLFQVPGGMAKFAAGVQARKQRNQSFSYDLVEPGLQLITGYDADGVPNEWEYGSDDLSFGAFYSRSFDDERRVNSVFAEFSIPIVNSVETQLAVRYEDYDDIGSEVSPKFAMSWRPFNSLLLRGSFSRSFRAPNVGLLYNGTNSGASSVRDRLRSQEVRAGLAEPTLENALPEAMFYTGVASPDLRSEHATTYNLGLIFTPETLEGFSAQIDYWRFEYKDRIVAQSGVQATQAEVDAFLVARADPNNYVTVQSLLSSAPTQFESCNPGALSGQARLDCVVDPRTYQVPSIYRPAIATQAVNVGDLVNVLRGNINAGTITTDGVDVKLGYGWDTSFGRFLLGLDYSYIHQYTISAPGYESGLLNTGIFDAAGTSGDGGAIARALPDHRGNVMLTWAQNAHQATAIVRAIGAYKYLAYDLVSNNTTINPAFRNAVSRTIQPYTTLDLSYTYSGMFGATNFSITAAILDVFEEDVPYVDTIGGAPGTGFQYDGTVYDIRGRRFKLTATVRF